MKNTLAVTACLKRCSVAISYENKIYEINQNVDAASNLVSLANELCEANKIDLHKLDGVVTASGPGSFTGIRVAQSFAKGIAIACGLPSLSVSYFDVIQHIFNTQVDKLAIVIKSEKNEAYYKMANTENFGVAPYEKLSQILTDDFTVIGEQIPYLANINFQEIPNFRDAKHLLSFEPTHNSFIQPLYINARL